MPTILCCLRHHQQTTTTHLLHTNDHESSFLKYILSKIALIALQRAKNTTSNTTSKKKAFETLLVPARSRSRNGKSLGGSSRQEIGSVSQHVTVSHKQATNAVKEKESSDSGIRERKRPTTIMVRLLSLFSLRLLL